MTGPGLTLAGVALVLAVLWANFRPWWKGDRDPARLKAFGTGALLGALSTMCGGGLLGYLTGCSAGVANTGGSKAVAGATGQQAAAQVTTASLGSLTPAGAVVVFLITCGTVFAFRAAGKDERKRMVGGVFCGVCLCLTAGVASALNWLPGLINGAGAQLQAAVQGAGIL